VAATVVEKSILVTVLDKEGAPIKDLAAAEFSVTEDGARREVTGASLATDLLFVCVLIDTSKSPAGDVDRLRDLRTSLGTFVKTIHATNPTAEIALMTVGGAGVLVKDSTDQTVELERITSRLVPDHRENAVVLEALIDAARGLTNKPSPRRAIVTIDFASMERSEVQPTTVITEVLKSGASVWSVSVHGSQGLSAPRRDTALNFLTKNTGGVRTTVLVPSALEQLLKKLAESLTAQYVVTYTRPDGTTPKSIVPSAKRGSKFLMSPVIQ
ncbi:MAG: hypothetical protein ABIP90_07270, partial [Vicinamibacterales bacterium]